ncbi:acetylornithine/succinyldiaminopimelate/putrescine aminotransferase [Maribacter caenipelagi]|uniref:Acetylornithine/succinyldiaminopimelate/putresci ne aminotransferase n=1 Tax=Maribacter caenipelagi TaxID=1447781 RepID=A0A4R7D1D1_9FLAO|nr:aspartate aminotransferase family protein [Maribacter caenipelagi]TDS13334.1 acetylornithine/succinyldiaminopimelate/putrescine aminotransferase [Maribacter caenipelagi]
MNKDFLQYQAQTSPYPLGMEVSHASGSYIYDTDGNAHLDFVAGVSACTLGHCHPEVVKAIKKQVDKYMHVMVYGEYSQSPATIYTKLLAANLPAPLEVTYLVNSGTEAIEGALKLARRYTGRSEIIAGKSAYHGNTMGSLSLMDFEERKSVFRPLLPDIYHIEFNNEKDLEKITTKTACVILETIQGGAGFILPKNNYLKKVKARCKEMGALLILDEIQPGFGRTGKMFAFEHFDCIPDILVIGKGMASGLPVGAFTASKEIMNTLSENPKMGHITTFGGNPVIAASSLATLNVLLNSNLIADTLSKEALFKSLLKHPKIKEVRGKGLMLALIMDTPETANELVLQAKKKNLILFWLLFENRAVRISPPLTISEKEIREGCAIILALLNSMQINVVN